MAEAVDGDHTGTQGAIEPDASYTISRGLAQNTDG